MRLFSQNGIFTILGGTDTTDTRYQQNANDHDQWVGEYTHFFLKCWQLILNYLLCSTTLSWNHHRSSSSGICPRGPLEVTEVDEKVHSWMSSGVIQIFVVAVAVTTCLNKQIGEEFTKRLRWTKIVRGDGWQLTMNNVRPLVERGRSVNIEVLNDSSPFPFLDT